MEIPRKAFAVLISGGLALGWGCVNSSCRGGEVLPTGVSVGAVQYDGILELLPESCDRDVLLFARYWTTTNGYRISVVWAEPHGPGLYFAVYPPGLSISSSTDSFKVDHELYPLYSSTFQKPLGKPGVFTNMFGDYNIRNIRFAEEAALASRIYAVDFQGQTFSGEESLKALSTDGVVARDVERLQFRGHGKALDLLKIYCGGDQPTKTLSYEYLPTGQIRRLEASIPEGRMDVGFSTNGVNVTLRGTNYHYNEFTLRRYEGGRKCSVTYESIDLGSVRRSLPVRVEVRGGRGGRLLRLAQLGNYKLIPCWPQPADKGASDFGAFSKELREYRRLLVKYWAKPPPELSGVDRECAELLCEYFSEPPRGAPESVGELLRRVNVLIELNRMVGNEARLQRSYTDYLHALSDNGFTNMLLAGGSGVVEAEVRWDRRREANLLLERWIETAVQVADVQSLLWFACKKNSEGNPWLSNRLLERLASRGDMNAEDRFERSAMRCMALDQSLGLVKSLGTLKNANIKAQAEWILFNVDEAELTKCIENCLREAQRELMGVKSFTERRIALKRKLDQMCERFKGEAFN